MPDLGEGDVFLFDGGAAKRIMEATLDQERQLDGPNRRPHRSIPPANVQFVLVSSNTATDGVLYPCTVQLYDSATATYTDLAGTCWARAVDGSGLSTGTRYAARMYDKRTADGLPIFVTFSVDPCCTSGSAGGGQPGGTRPPGTTGCDGVVNGIDIRRYNCATQYTHPIIINGVTWFYAINQGELYWCGPGPEPASGPGPGWYRSGCVWFAGPGSPVWPRPGGGGGIVGLPGGGGGIVKPFSDGLDPLLGPGPGIIMEPIPPYPGNKPTLPGWLILPGPGSGGGGVSVPYPATPGGGGGKPLFRAASGGGCGCDEPRPTPVIKASGGCGCSGAALTAPPIAGGIPASVPLEMLAVALAQDAVASSGVTSVNGRTGAVTILSSDVISANGGTLTPAALTANVNDYAPGSGYAIYAVSTDGTGDKQITGLAISQVDGQEITIINVSSIDNIILPKGSASSAAANRWRKGTTAGNITIAAGGVCVFRYTASRWEQMQAPF